MTLMDSIQGNQEGRGQLLSMKTCDDFTDTAIRFKTILIVVYEYSLTFPTRVSEMVMTGLPVTYH